MNVINSKKLNDLVITRFEYIPNDEIENYFQSCSAVILPYKKIYQSGVALLSMSYGLPIITSDLEPFKELIIHGENGFIFESNSPNELAKLLIKISNYDLSKISLNSYETAKNKYSWKKSGSLTTKLYSSII